jgi:hypothetical protein
VPPDPHPRAPAWPPSTSQPGTRRSPGQEPTQAGHIRPIFGQYYGVPNIRRHLDRLHLGTFTGPAGTFRQRTELTKPQRDLLAKLAITPPKQIVELDPA